MARTVISLWNYSSAWVKVYPEASILKMPVLVLIFPWRRRKCSLHFSFLCDSFNVSWFHFLTASSVLFCFLHKSSSISLSFLPTQGATTWPVRTEPWPSSRTSRRSRQPGCWALRPGTHYTSGTDGALLSVQHPLWTTFRYHAWPEPILNIQAVSLSCTNSK